VKWCDTQGERLRNRFDTALCLDSVPGVSWCQRVSVGPRRLAEGGRAGAPASYNEKDLYEKAKREKEVSVYSYSSAGKVYSVLPAGADVILQVRKGDLILTIRETRETTFDMGDRIHVRLPIESMLLYDKEGGNLLYPPPDA